MAIRPEAKHWCFTLNNPDDDEASIAQQLTDLGAVYAIYQLEQGQNETAHFQGYVMLETKARLSAVRTLFNGRAHWEIARGSPEQNRTYCSKPEGQLSPPCEVGIFPENAGQGKRSDLNEVHFALQHGLDAATYRDEYFPLFVRYPRLLENYEAAGSRPRSLQAQPSCVLFLGPPGTGKSTLAARMADAGASLIGGPGVFRKHPGKWWDGYRGERVVLFDDFRGSSMSFTDFKLAIDRFPVRVEIKGASRYLEASSFFITSNYSPKTWWDPLVTSGMEAAIFRRITEVYFFVAFGRYQHYPSYAAFQHDHETARPEDSPFIVETPVQAVPQELPP